MEANCKTHTGRRKRSLLCRGSIVVVLVATWSGSCAPKRPTVQTNRLERVLTAPRYDLEIKGLTQNTINVLSAVSGVPFGFEEVGALTYSPRPPCPAVDDPIPPYEPPTRTQLVAAEGQRLRYVLTSLVAVNPEYEWRDMQGVVVIRPIGSWGNPSHPLAVPAPPVQSKDMRAEDPLRLVLQALRLPAAVEDPSQITFPDRKRFAMDFRSGTALDLLNAIVRQHGELTWMLTRSSGCATPGMQDVGNIPVLFINWPALRGGSGQGWGFVPRR